VDCAHNRLKGGKFMKMVIPTYKEVEKKHGELLSMSKAALYFNLDKDGLRYLIQNKNQFNHIYFEVGIDIQPKEGIGGQNSRYYFPKSFLDKEKENLPYLMYLKDVAKELDIPFGKLRYMLDKGYLDGGRYTHRKYDFNWIKENLDEIQKKIDQPISFMPGYEGSALDFISTHGGEKISKYVNGYIQSRINGDGIPVNGDNKYHQKMKNPERNAPKYRSQLSIALYKIICGRSGIDDYWEKNNDRSFRELTLEEIQKFNPVEFMIWDISDEDVLNIKRGYTDLHFKRLMEQHFIPFLYFVKNKYEQQKRKLRIKKQTRRELTEKEQMEYFDVMETIEIFNDGIQMTKQKIPYEAEPLTERIPYRFKREEIHLILQNLRTSNMQDKLKKECMLLFDIFTGVRPGELV
jgi:hypothetical protein